MAIPQADEALTGSGTSYEISFVEDDLGLGADTWGGGVCTNVDPCTFLSSWFLAMTIVSRRVSVKVRKNYLVGNDPEPGEL